MPNILDHLESEIEDLRGLPIEEEDPVYIVSHNLMSALLKPYSELKHAELGLFFGQSFSEWLDSIHELEMDYIFRLEDLGHLKKLGPELFYS